MLYYVIGLGVAVLLWFVFPFGLVILAGLVVGGLMRLSDRVKQLENRLNDPTGPGESVAAGTGALAERERVRRKLAHYAAVAAKGKTEQAVEGSNGRD